MSDGTIDPKHQPGTPARSRADTIQKFFRRPFFLSLTIGIPFCIFKLLFGIVAIGIESPSFPFLPAAGWLIIAWAGIDLLLNAGRAVLDLFSRKSPFEYCTIAQIGRFFGMPAVFLALDTVIAFTIICLMLWSGWITRLTPPEAYLWYAATTLNLISLSLVSLYVEIRRRWE
jgi:hypothetical protein